MDGPAGAGKSSIAKQLAQQLDFAFLDTGAMYRCATLACINQAIEMTNREAVEKCANSIQIDFQKDRILMDGVDVTDSLRTPDVTQSIKYIADNARVRERMVELQRTFAGNRDIVTEGRDQEPLHFLMPNAKSFDRIS